MVVSVHSHQVESPIWVSKDIEQAKMTFGASHCSFMDTDSSTFHCYTFQYDISLFVSAMNFQNSSLIWLNEPSQSIKERVN